MIRYLKTYPLYREQITQVNDLNINDIQALLSNTQKVLFKLNEI